MWRRSEAHWLWDSPSPRAVLDLQQRGQPRASTDGLCRLVTAPPRAVLAHIIRRHRRPLRELVEAAPDRSGGRSSGSAARPAEPGRGRASLAGGDVASLFSRAGASTEAGRFSPLDGGCRWELRASSRDLRCVSPKQPVLWPAASPPIQNLTCAFAARRCSSLLVDFRCRVSPVCPGVWAGGTTRPLERVDRPGRQAGRSLRAPPTAERDVAAQTEAVAFSRPTSGS